ncbi:MAG: hypothetical protein IPL53_05515 [Ignavibacteria bacterium]|nr:hypothetical protein [Ignavibacteria bacterium]
MNLRRVIYSILLLLTLSSAIVFNSCSDDSVTGPIVTPAIPEPDMTTYFKVDSGYVTGANCFLQLYADDSLRTGYNPFYFVLHDSITGELITDAHITILPINHGHAAPAENPDEDAPDGIFKGAMVFTQSFTDNPMHWHITFLIHNHQSPGEPEGEVEFSPPVILDNSNFFKSIVMPDSTALYLSNITPNTPVAGMNDFEFLINKNEPELYPPDGTYTIQMNPVFLSDGHTTTGNVAPVGSSNGHYSGKINFDQSGNWRVNLIISKNGHSYNTYFDMSY